MLNICFLADDHNSNIKRQTNYTDEKLQFVKYISRRFTLRIIKSNNAVYNDKSKNNRIHTHIKEKTSNSSLTTYFYKYFFALKFDDTK